MSTGQPLKVVNYCAGPGPTLALQELLPPGMRQVMTASELDEVFHKLAKMDAVVGHSLQNFETAVAGERFCNSEHGPVTGLP